MLLKQVVVEFGASGASVKRDGVTCLTASKRGGMFFVDSELVRPPVAAAAGEAARPKTVSAAPAESARKGTVEGLPVTAQQFQAAGKRVYDTFGTAKLSHQLYARSGRRKCLN
ncbi:hypothetical protein GPECTOR_5g365 [Gonium pectorale]|uniref:Uncharacterized protein n=1 Tax=Gonium pectorale TaxID=33097 RepID=A0A150GWK6_GONPE|nr:hypothetical protein GPECTOR_5g365 [Gonium pectorale]|eukprot:KXZ54277.1 hypothetical protein GPECTOR_5g365 [Gonium pectorale]